uniref:Uncharacterized protein n=1 Tax=Rhizophora mucronata TaxID=61149 RepID=A0A2P2PTB8_RHIMU
MAPVLQRASTLVIEFVSSLSIDFARPLIVFPPPRPTFPLTQPNPTQPIVLVILNPRIYGRPI